jgi:hypothetical protein
MLIVRIFKSTRLLRNVRLIEMELIGWFIIKASVYVKGSIRSDQRNLEKSGDPSFRSHWPDAQRTKGPKQNNVPHIRLFLSPTSKSVATISPWNTF